MQADSTKNRRKFPRFKVENDIFVLHSDFGKVMEIGMGSIAFTYVEKNAQKNGHNGTGALFNQNDDYIIELPFKTISDTVVRKSTSARLNIRKRVVVFGDLEGEQVERLEKFILDNVTISKNNFYQI
ncbi:MAG: hypothetical protein KQH63_14885 [Desulfobulbaceae bacterium]|nr:hypothetical protein [Desulfobulbaceae bacterium]